MGNQNNKHKKNNSINPRSMAREGMKAIRNMAFGNFDFYREGQMFRNVDLVKATIEEIDKLLLDVSIHISAITSAYPATNDSNVLSLLRRDRRKYDAYAFVKQVLSMVIWTGDTGHIWALLTRLPDYKYDL